MKTRTFYPYVWLIAALIFTACSTETLTESADSLDQFDSNSLKSNNLVDPCSYSDGIIASFNPFFGEFPEGVEMDIKGNLYSSFAPLGLIVKINCDGSYFPIANLGPTPLADGELLLGLETDNKGMVYAALSAPGKSYNGVWRIDPTKQMTPIQLAGSQQIFFPNDLTFDNEGNLYVTSTTGPPTGPGTFAPASIWKIPQGGMAELWIANTSLTGIISPLTPIPVPLGANGIAYRNKVLYVSVTSKYQIVTIDIESDGSPGTPQILTNLFDVSNPFAGTPDGIAVDVRGNVYVPTVADHKILRISPDGSEVEELANSSNNLTNPASITFGKTSNNQKSLFITNFAIPDLSKPATPTGPAVVKINVGIAGSPKS